MPTVDAKRHTQPTGALRQAVLAELKSRFSSPPCVSRTIRTTRGLS